MPIVLPYLGPHSRKFGSDLTSHTESDSVSHVTRVMRHVRHVKIDITRIMWHVT